MSVEHRPSHPLLIRLAERTLTRLFSSQDSCFRYAFMTRCRRPESAPRRRDSENERMRRTPLPLVGFMTRQFTSTSGDRITGLDVVYNRACPLAPRQPSREETRNATRRLSSASFPSSMGRILDRGFSSAPERGPPSPFSGVGNS